MLRCCALLVLSTLSLGAQTLDLYPQVHALVLEAESDFGNIRLLDDRSDPRAWAGRIYAHAGYLDDAARLLVASNGQSNGPPYPLWRAWVVYGQRDRAEKYFESVTDPERKTGLLSSLADLLWRMGQPAEARARFTAALQLADKVANPSLRKQLLASINQGLTFVSDAPPDLISATPHPRPNLQYDNSPVALFPITPDGFEDLPANGRAARNSANGDFLQKLYDRVAARDSDGLQRLTESALTPFQKTLGLASMEHLLILTYQPELAEQFANRIPETDSSSALAKAEALSAAGSAWLSSLDDKRARSDFRSAIRVAQTVHNAELGKISVLSSIAAAQFKAGFIEDSKETFRAVILLAQSLPQRPKPQPGVSNTIPAGVHYRDEAFNNVLLAAIRVRDIEIATDLTALRNQMGDPADAALVNAWLDADRPEEALAAVRGIQSPQVRISARLNVAQTLLERAGAPNF